MSLFRPKTALNSLWPSLAIIWTFGCASVGVKRTWRIPYAITMSVITLYLSMYLITRAPSPENRMTSYFVSSTSCFNILSSLVLIWTWELKGARALENSILEMTKLDEELKNFGLKMNHRKFLFKQLITIVSFLVLFLLAGVLRQPLTINMYDLRVLQDSTFAYLLLTLSFNVQYFQALLGDLVFIMMLEAFRRRFKLVNEVFERIAESEDRIEVKVFDTSCSRVLDVSGIRFQDGIAKRHLSSHLVMEKVDRACRIHRRLLKVAQDIGDAFSLHLCLNCPNALLHTILEASKLVLFFTDDEGDLSSVGADLFSVLLTVTRFWQIIASCSNTIDEASKLGTSLYRVPINDAATHNQLQEHSIHIVQRKLRFTAGGVFVIDGNLARSVFSTVMKYMIVLLQFRKKN